MTRNAAHSTFEIARDLPAPPARVFRAWADETQKRAWSDCHAETPGVSYSLDFRVGGEELYRVVHADGAEQTVSKRFLDIAPEARIVFAYDIVVDGRRLSASLVTVEFSAGGRGTQMLYTEQIAWLDGHMDLEERIHGTAEGLDRLGLLVADGAAA